MMQSKQERAELAASAARNGTGPTEADVVRALRTVFEAKYAKSWGDREAAVDAALQTMEQNNSTSFAALTQIVNTGMFAGNEGRKGSIFVEAAVGAYVLLLKSLQEKHEVTTHPTHTKETHKRREEKPQADEDNDVHDKSQASEDSGASPSTGVESVMRRQGALEHAKAGGTLLEKATNKAAAEMAAQFNYETLCTQGRKLYEMVLIEKAKRIHTKVRYRKKKGSLSPGN